MCYVYICFPFFTWISKILINKDKDRRNHLNVLTFHNIIIVFFQNEKKHKYLWANHILKQRKSPGLYFFKMRTTWTHKVPTSYICNMSSKVFLSKPHTKTEKPTWTWVSYILKEVYNFLEILLLWQIQKYLSANHVSKLKKPLKHDCHIFQKNFIITCVP